MRKLHVDGGERCGDATSNQALKKYKRCKVPWILKYCSIGVFVYINNRGCYKIKTKKLIAFWEQLHYLNQWMLQGCILEPVTGELNPNQPSKCIFLGLPSLNFFRASRLPDPLRGALNPPPSTLKKPPTGELWCWGQLILNGDQVAWDLVENRAQTVHFWWEGKTEGLSLEQKPLGADWTVIKDDPYLLPSLELNLLFLKSGFSSRMVLQMWFLFQKCCSFSYPPRQWYPLPHLSCTNLQFGYFFFI